MSRPNPLSQRVAHWVGMAFIVLFLLAVSYAARAATDAGGVTASDDAATPGASTPPITYPPSLTTDPEKACYRTYLSDLAVCGAAYNAAVAACDSTTNNYFSRQACYLSAYFTWDSCAGSNGAGGKYGTCLSAAWKQVGKYQAQ